jgi:hypothetical protein
MLVKVQLVKQLHGINSFLHIILPSRTDELFTELAQLNKVLATFLSFDIIQSRELLDRTTSQDLYKILGF